jgi:hypothetical protein
MKNIKEEQPILSYTHVKLKGRTVNITPIHMSNSNKDNIRLVLSLLF